MPTSSLLNFAEGTLNVGISNVATSLTMVSGQGARFPNPGTNYATSFNAVIWNSTDYSNPSDDPSVEWVTVTARSTDTMTITRGVDGTSASNHNTGGKTYKIVNAIGYAFMTAMLSGQGEFGADIGTIAGTMVVNQPLWPASYSQGQYLVVWPAFANPGATTINVNGMGAKNIVRPGGTALVAGDIPLGQMCELVYDGTNWELVSFSYANPTTAVNVQLVGKSLAAGTAVTASVSGGVATVVHSGHTYVVGDVVVMAGGTSSGGIGDFNSLKVITSSNQGGGTYTFNTTAGNGSITGSPVEMFWFKGTRSWNVTKLSNITRSATGFVTVALTNTQPDGYYGISAEGYGAGANNQFGVFPDNNHLPGTTSFGLYCMTLSSGANAGADALSYLSISLTGII